MTCSPSLGRFILIRSLQGLDNTRVETWDPNQIGRCGSNFARAAVLVTSVPPGCSDDGAVCGHDGIQVSIALKPNDPRSICCDSSIPRTPIKRVTFTAPATRPSSAILQHKIDTGHGNRPLAAADAGMPRQLNFLRFIDHFNSPINTLLDMIIFNERIYF